MPDLAEPARNASTVDVRGMAYASTGGRCGAVWGGLAILLQSGLNRYGPLRECLRTPTQLRSERRCFHRGTVR